jgi:hypothetical protein
MPHGRVGRAAGQRFLVVFRGAQVAAGQFEPLGRVALLDRGRALDGDVLVGQPLVLGAEAEPADRLDGPGLRVLRPVLTFTVPPGW